MYVTCPDRAVARTLARTVVEERLAACANLLGEIESIYWWEGAVQQEGEVGVLLKTTEERVADLTGRLVALHPYECPCVVSLPVSGGHGPFLDWVRESVG